MKFQVKTLPELLQMSSVIGSAIQDTDSVSFKSLVSKCKPYQAILFSGQVVHYCDHRASAGLYHIKVCDCRGWRWG